jgi:hypothetical protein
MKFEKCRCALRHLLNQLVMLILRRHHQCEKCGSWDTIHSHRWTRGWNNWCEQAYGDWGARCNKCKHITWDEPIDEHIKTLPTWCEPYNAVLKRAE